MRTRTKWIVAGGAAAFVLTPIASVYGSSALEADLQHGGVVIDAELANRARAAQPDPAKGPDPEASTAAKAKAAQAAKAKTEKANAENAKAEKAKAEKAEADRAKKEKASREPTGKKTVSASSPVSPGQVGSAASPVSAG